MNEADIQRWRHLRLAYLSCLVALFAAVAFYFGPNYFLFHKLTWITPADFAPTVESRCVPVVRAMKEFRRDHGRMPARAEELVPRYLPELKGYGPASVDDGKFNWWAQYNHFIHYDFDPANEGWTVEGAFTRGRIPLPPVIVSPATSQPTATRPATRASAAPE